MEKTIPMKDNSKRNYFRYLERLKTDQDWVPKNKEFAIRFLSDCEMGKTILKGEKKKIGYKRLIRLCGLLKNLSCNWLKKPFDEATQ